MPMDNRTSNNAGQFYWWFGVVEDRNDPLRMGRCRVRIMGYHIDSKEILPTEDLPWAFPIMPANNPSISGTGTSSNGVVNGTWVVGFFADGSDGQHPMIFGTVGAVPGGPYGDPCAPAGGNSTSDDGNTDGGGGIATGPFLEVAAKFIAHFEGFVRKAYHLGTENYMTIGFGHQIQNEDMNRGYIDLGDGTKVQLASKNGSGTIMSKDQATKLLQLDLQRKYAGGTKAAAGAAWDKMNDNQKAALISYTYNCGAGATKRLCNAGIIGAMMNGNIPGAAQVIRDRGIKTGQGQGVLKGLVKRRNAEAALFQNGTLP